MKCCCSLLAVFCVVSGFTLGLLLVNTQDYYQIEEDLLLDKFRCAESQSCNLGTGSDFVDDQEMLNKSNGTTFSIMSFNIRLDGPESNPKNHFSKRVDRLAETILRWSPAVIGLQEPFAPQVHHLLGVLKSHQGRERYTPIGYEYPGITEQKKNNLLDPRRHNHFNNAILYRRDLLKLEDKWFWWLSETPEVEDSRSWGSGGVRTANAALFTVLEKKDEREGGEGEDGEMAHTKVLVFNTHLDREDESARRGQARFLRTKMEELSRLHPDALLFVTGDFNSAPGQAAHQTLLSSPSAAEGHNKEQRSGFRIKDAWAACLESGGASPPNCKTNHVAVSFHGWLGSRWLDTALSRLLHFVVFTFHGMQLNLPLSPPNHRNWRELWRAARNVFTKPPQYGVYESMPELSPSSTHAFWRHAFSRYHVDWILFSPQRNLTSTAARTPSGISSSSRTTAAPLAVLVADAWRQPNQHSSDHFPIVAVFELKTMKPEQ